MDKIKQLINAYSRDEFGDEADFSNLHKIPLAYTTITDKEIDIQVDLDVIGMKLTRYNPFDEFVYEKDCIQFESTTEIEEFLYWSNFGDLVDIDLEDNYPEYFAQY